MGAFPREDLAHLEPVGRLPLGNLHPLQEVLPRIEDRSRPFRPGGPAVDATPQSRGDGDAGQHLFQISVRDQEKESPKGEAGSVEAQSDGDEGLVHPDVELGQVLVAMGLRGKRQPGAVGLIAWRPAELGEVRVQPLDAPPSKVPQDVLAQRGELGMQEAEDGFAPARAVGVAEDREVFRRETGKLERDRHGTNPKDPAIGSASL